MTQHNTHNEIALLGAVMRDPSRFQDVAEVITHDDFSWHSYGYVWKAMQSLHERGLAIDVITVGDELERTGQIVNVQSDGAQFSGRAALNLIREEGNPSNVDSYAAKVIDYSAKRKLFDLMSKGVNWSQNGRTAGDIIHDITKEMSDIRVFDGKSASHTQTLSDSVSDAYDHTDAAAAGRIEYVMTGYIDLDEMLGGLSAPDLCVIAARPGQGKTAFLASVAMNAAKKQKKVAFFSLEMNNRQIAMRLIAMESGVSYDRQKRGKLREDEWPIYTHTVEKMSDRELYPIYLNDMPAIKPSQIRQELRRIGKVDLVMIDYIQLADADGSHENRNLEITQVTRGLKSICKEFNVPILAAAQLSRAVEQRADKRPMLSDLRESGSIENDADVVMFIYRPDQYEKDTAKQNTAEIIVSKQRNGPVGTIELIYRPQLTRFENAVSKVFRTYESE